MERKIGRLMDGEREKVERESEKER